MTIEELLELVNKKEDTSKFTSLSKKSIDDELNDVLGEMGDDDDENDRIVTKLANRLKRMDKNLHKNIADELKKSREEAERKKKEEEERKRKRNRAKENDDDDDDGGDDDRIAKLLAKVEALEKASAERDKEAARKATLESVKAGLKEKFDKAGLELNGFFLKTSLSKLEIPDKDADIDDLVSEAEKIYTADFKEATGEKGIPSKNHTSSPGGGGDDDKFMEEVAARRKKRFGDSNDDSAKK
uniref:hypothetical protein n=1 Tax=Prevotella sp. TaxID=59823 RepID=UPI004024B83C